ncbi:MAG: thiamine-phosphate kinase [Promethearchaeota archaeon]
MRAVGERALLEYIRSLVPPVDITHLSANDDAVAWPAGGGRLLVANTDMLVGSTDVPAQMDPSQAGKKAVVMNVSDLAVKGVVPEAMVVALGIPPDWRVGGVGELVRGIIAGCESYQLAYIGGDMNEAPDLVVCPTAWGFASAGKLLRRDGARPGDILAVNGEFGLTGVGFKVLLDGLRTGEEAVERAGIVAVLEPSTRVEDGVVLASRGLASASIDSSDGLYTSLAELGSGSGVGFELERVLLPVPPAVQEFADKSGDLTTFEELVFQGGEEFVHVFTIPEDDWEEARRAVAGVGGQLHCVGTVTEERGVLLVDGSKRTEVTLGGWEHWRGR